MAVSARARPGITHHSNASMRLLSGCLHPAPASLGRGCERLAVKLAGVGSWHQGFMAKLEDAS